MNPLDPKILDVIKLKVFLFTRAQSNGCDITSREMALALARDYTLFSEHQIARHFECNVAAVESALATVRNWFAGLEPLSRARARWWLLISASVAREVEVVR